MLLDVTFLKYKAKHFFFTNLTFHVKLKITRNKTVLDSAKFLFWERHVDVYGWRFKIEVSFRTLIHRLGGFFYRFWLKSMTSTPTWPRNLSLADYDEVFQQKVARKVEAFERFVNLNALALGMLQVLALEMPNLVWKHFRMWFRTLPSHGFPSEQIVRLCLELTVTIPDGPIGCRLLVPRTTRATPSERLL